MSESRPIPVAAAAVVVSDHPWFQVSSDYRRLVRVIARVVQVCRFFRSRVSSQPRPPPPKRRRKHPNTPLTVVTHGSIATEPVPLSVDDFRRARDVLTQCAQRNRFYDCLTFLGRASPTERLPKACAWMQPLSPFLDASGVLRVGGRLRNADISYSAEHQAILPSRHPLFLSWVRSLHLTNFHAGSSLIINIVRQSHWLVPDALRIVRREIAKCVQCRRYSPSLSQRMGDLPPPQVRPAPPFSHTGVDYAGPFLLRRSRGRSARIEEKI